MITHLKPNPIKLSSNHKLNPKRKGRVYNGTRIAMLILNSNDPIVFSTD